MRLLLPSIWRTCGATDREWCDIVKNLRRYVCRLTGYFDRVICPFLRCIVVFDKHSHPDSAIPPSLFYSILQCAMLSRVSSISRTRSISDQYTWHQLWSLVGGSIMLSSQVIVIVYYCYMWFRFQICDRPHVRT